MDTDDPPALADLSFFVVPYVDAKTDIRTKDEEFCTQFYKFFKDKKTGAGLGYDGYRRAITLYGGEQALIAGLRSVGAGFAAFRKENEAAMADFRQKIKNEGYDGQVTRTLARTVFALCDSAQSTTYDEARKIARIFPQPSWLVKMESHAINVDGRDGVQYLAAEDPARLAHILPRQGRDDAQSTI